MNCIRILLIRLKKQKSNREEKKQIFIFNLRLYNTKVQILSKYLNNININKILLFTD